MPDPRSDGSGAMFDRIARRYDLLNLLMSFGLDRRWRRELIAALELSENGRALDVATGTADVAIGIARAIAVAQVVGLDPSDGMLAVGRDKVAAANLDDRVELVAGDAEDMPFADDTFDAACISFGIRNVPDRAGGLREMGRVTRPGGVVAVLELAEPRGALARFHVGAVVPRLGALISGDREYRYLRKSIAAFPPPEEFAALMQGSGLTDVHWRPMSFAAANLYIGRA